MGAIMTTYAFGSDKGCALVKWCWNAHAASDRLLNGSADVVVYTDDERAVRELCPRALIRPFDAALTAAIKRWTDSPRVDLSLIGADGRRRPSPTKLSCPYTFYKFQLLMSEYASVLYLDADVDLSFGHVNPLSRTLQPREFRSYLRAFESSNCYLRATPDHSAIVNDGVFLLRPERRLYSEVLSILRRGVWNTSAGFDHAGRPQATMTPLGKPANAVKRAMGYWKNTWDTVCGAGSQGLFAHLYLVHTRSYCEPLDWWVRVRHFWGGEKPWTRGGPHCPQYYRFPHHSPRACTSWLARGAAGAPSRLAHGAQARPSLHRGPTGAGRRGAHGRGLPSGEPPDRGLLAAEQCAAGRNWPIL